MTTPPPTSNLDLIARAEATGEKRLVTLASRASAALDALTEALQDYETKSEARAEIERLEAELAAARAKLSPPRKSAAAQSSSSSVDTKTIRAWARAQGFTVPDRGTLPSSIVEDYQREHPA